MRKLSDHHVQALRHAARGHSLLAGCQDTGYWPRVRAIAELQVLGLLSLEGGITERGEIVLANPRLFRALTEPPPRITGHAGLRRVDYTRPPQWDRRASRWSCR